MHPCTDPCLAALGQLLDAYAELDALLDAFAGADPEGLTKDEKKRQRASNAARDRALATWQRLAVGTGERHA